MEPVEIVIRRTGQPDRTARFGEGVVRVGRAEDNEIVLSDVGVSRKHAQIRISRGEVTLLDLGSGNGCYLDGRRVDNYAVKNGDEIVIDPFVLEFRLKKSAPAPAPAAPRPTARLDVIAGNGMASSSYPIGPRGLSMGRSEDREVVVPDPAASRHHCSVIPQNGEYLLRDMGSANGVYVNGNRARDHVLADGDVIRIGNTELRFVRYESSEGDTTTHIVGGGHHVAGAVDRLPTRPTPARPRPRRSGGMLGPALVIAVLGAVALLAVATLGGLGTLGYVVYSWNASAVSWPAPHAPRWVMALPGGLPEASTADLFEAGVGKMQAGDNEGALRDFYRILVTSPGDAPAEKFSFAAGEFLVLDQLEESFQRGLAARQDRDAARERLLTAARSGDAQAKSKLEAEFRDDPIAAAAMGWAPSPAQESLTAKARKAAELQAAGDYAEAARLYREILPRAKDPVLRATADAGRLACRRELARQVAAPWSEAARLDAFGDPKAAEAWATVKRMDPDNPSAKLHSQR